MYDVLFFERERGCRIVGCGLARDSAAKLAREEARRRHVGRMFLSGSAAVPRHHAVVIVKTGPERA